MCVFLYFICSFQLRALLYVLCAFVILNKDYLLTYKFVVSYVRTLTTCHCPCRALLLQLSADQAVQQWIDISCMPGPQQQICSSTVRRAEPIYSVFPRNVHFLNNSVKN